ncbi:DUF1819 family protein [Prevotella cerevisiae]|uniref:DUF1819 family protein n=1 Tax=Segatella cerevisiae TaxID=2053716 RepID=A0ABT1BWR8_9BACT|nr:BrxA family protein [Segatella cerevisiae]MCO6024887.1 DUF1819 family protein [Segatella cerevisiae]
MNKMTSPYLSLTGCSFLYYEFRRILPLLMAPDSDRLLKEEVEHNHVMQVNTLSARKRFISEFKRRFRSVPRTFWETWEKMGENGQRVGLFYVLLKTYKLIFDFHFDVTVRKWNSVDRHLNRIDLIMEMNEIAAKDENVGSWSDKTKDRCISHYITILRQTGLIEGKDNQLVPVKISASDSSYYFRTGETWFLEACLLYPYEIENLKSQQQ